MYNLSILSIPFIALNLEFILCESTKTIIIYAKTHICSSLNNKFNSYNVHLKKIFISSLSLIDMIKLFLEK